MEKVTISEPISSLRTKSLPRAAGFDMYRNASLVDCLHRSKGGEQGDRQLVRLCICNACIVTVGDRGVNNFARRGARALQSRCAPFKRRRQVVSDCVRGYLACVCAFAAGVRKSPPTPAERAAERPTDTTDVARVAGRSIKTFRLILRLCGRRAAMGGIASCLVPPIEPRRPLPVRTSDVAQA